MQRDADGGHGPDWRLPAAPAVRDAPGGRGVAPAEFRTRNRRASRWGRLIGACSQHGVVAYRRMVMEKRKGENQDASARSIGQGNPRLAFSPGLWYAGREQ